MLTDRNPRASNGNPGKDSGVRGIDTERRKHYKIGGLCHQRPVDRSRQPVQQAQSSTTSTWHARRMTLVSPAADTRDFSITSTRTRDPVCNKSMSSS